MSHQCSRRDFLIRSVVLSTLWTPLVLGAQVAKKQPAQQKKSRSTGNPVAVKVKHIIARQLGVDEAKVVPTARFVEDLEADSLDVVELVMAWEEAFDMEIRDEDCEKIHTVQEAIDFIRSHQKSSGNPAAKPKSK